MAKAVKIKTRPVGATIRKTTARSKTIANRVKPASGSKTASKPRPAATEIELRNQARQVVRALAKTYPDAKCALHHKSAYQLLVATILSAQCTDVRVNMVTPVLFARYPDARALASASQSDLEEIIRSTGFFRAKAASLLGMARAVVEQHGGEIPKTLDELVELPGVGRKTANVVLGTIWAIASGIVVDTHVKRITTLLGLTRSTSAEPIEQDLMKIVPQSEWVNFSHRLIHHGRKVCIARRPKCLECSLLSCCRRVGLPPLK
jgi:endonuclease III